MKFKTNIFFAIILTANWHCQKPSSSSDDSIIDTKSFFTTTDLKLRKAPSKKAESIKTYPKGSILIELEKSKNKDQIDGIESTWSKVKDDSSVTGWVFGGYLANPQRYILKIKDDPELLLSTAENIEFLHYREAKIFYEYIKRNFAEEGRYFDAQDMNNYGSYADYKIKIVNCLKDSEKNEKVASKTKLLEKLKAYFIRKDKEQLKSLMYCEFDISYACTDVGIRLPKDEIDFTDILDSATIFNWSSVGTSRLYKDAIYIMDNKSSKESPDFFKIELKNVNGLWFWEGFVIGCNSKVNEIIVNK